MIRISRYSLGLLNSKKLGLRGTNWPSTLWQDCLILATVENKEVTIILLVIFSSFIIPKWKVFIPQNWLPNPVKAFSLFMFMCTFAYDWKPGKYCCFYSIMMQQKRTSKDRNCQWCMIQHKKAVLSHLQYCCFLWYTLMMSWKRLFHWWTYKMWIPDSLTGTSNPFVESWDCQALAQAQNEHK